MATSKAESLAMAAALSVVIIGVDEERRRRIASAFSGPQSRVIREISSYPDYDDLAQVSAGAFDVVLIDMDADTEKALEITENLAAGDTGVTVMVYSGRLHSDLLMRCMRAGAREFLAEPVSPNTVAEALVRASVRRDEAPRLRKPVAKLFVFTAAKGGSGVTTIASNFAVLLARECNTTEGKTRESRQKGRAQGENPDHVVLLDLNLPLGDAALALGVSGQYSVADALQNIARVDADFLGVMMTRHSSGLCVMCAPDRILNLRPSEADIEKLLAVSRDSFRYVVVDAGSLPAEYMERLTQSATTVYLVTQPGVPDLRNANRFLARYFDGRAGGKVEVILNRYVARTADIEEQAITKALGGPVRWKVPEDNATVRRAQNTGAALVLQDSAIARSIAAIAQEAAGNKPAEIRKKRFGIFG